MVALPTVTGARGVLFVRGCRHLNTQVSYFLMMIARYDDDDPMMMIMMMTSRHVCVRRFFRYNFQRWGWARKAESESVLTWQRRWGALSLVGMVGVDVVNSLKA